MADRLRFHALGPMRVTKGMNLDPPRAPRLRQVLALLAVADGNRVTYEELVTELWGETPPKSAVATIQTFVYQLRSAAVRHGWVGAEEDLVVTCPRGYQLAIRPDQTDVHEFAKLSRDGQRLLDLGRNHEALVRLRQAESLWQGRALSDLTHGKVLSHFVDSVEEDRVQVGMLRVCAEVRRGCDGSLIEDLRALVRNHPRNEWFHQQLVRALFRARRREEALLAYEDLRRMLDEELGLAPATDFTREFEYELNGTAHLALREHVVRA